MTSSQVNVSETPPVSRADLETLAKNETDENGLILGKFNSCLLYTSPSPRDNR